MCHISTLWYTTKRVAQLNFMLLLERKKKNSFVLVTKMLLLDRVGALNGVCVRPCLPPPLPHCPPCLLRSLWADSCIAAVGFTDVQLYSDCALTSAFQPPPATANPVITPSHPPGDESIVSPDQTSDFGVLTQRWMAGAIRA